MIEIFTFNPFAENTYVLYDDTKECVIIDPGCYTASERAKLQGFIEANKLNPVRHLNTHCHLDHVFGNAFVQRTWGLGVEIHRNEIPVLDRFPVVCQMYGIPDTDPPLPAAAFLEEGGIISFGHTQLQILLTPGHSPGSLCFYCEAEGFVIGGDVLFYESIGRTDLTGGNPEQLLESIRTKLFPLPGETLVYPGHGPTTTIRHEQEYNPFL